jgi:dolichol-phosphate mannosyltransferase
MSDSDKYSVILPTYNEKENLPIITYLIMEMAEEHKLDLEIVIVDDNSPDGTGDVAD